MYALLLVSLLADDATKDAAKLEGTWVIVSAVENGKPLDEIKGDKLTFKDGTLTIKTKEKDEKGTFKLDSSAKPKTIDFTEEGKDKTIQAIYILDGDVLKICAAHKPGEKRPTEFSAKEGSGQMLIELKREKKDK